MYCLARAIVGPAGASNLYPPLLDYCAPVLPGIGRSPFAALFHAAERSGSTIVTPIPGFSLVALGEAIYLCGVPLQTSKQPQAAFTGVIGTSFDSAALLRSLLGDHRSPAAGIRRAAQRRARPDSHGLRRQGTRLV